MNKTKEQAIALSQTILLDRFPNADVGFCAGSIVRGEGTPSSDIDLVVLFKHLPFAWRESFIYQGWPVEAFVHDPETFHYFAKELDAKSGTSHLANMVLEGIPVPAITPLSTELKVLAKKILEEGPPQLTAESIHHTIYALTDLVDDLRTPRSISEAQGSGASLYHQLGDFILRANNQWAGSGKSLSRQLRKFDPVLEQEFTTSFDTLFATGNTQPVIQLAEKVLKPFGGLVFDGYKRNALPAWRKPV